MFRSIDRVFFVAAAISLFGLTQASSVSANFKPDLAISSFQMTTGDFCSGDGRGGFACSPVVGDSPNAFRMAAGDVDGNRYTDLVFAINGEENVICYGIAPPETFGCNTVRVGGGKEPNVNATSSVAIGRMNGDAFPDLVFANNAGQRDRLCTWAFMGLFNCSDVSADQRSSADVALGDFDGDENLDAVFADVSASEESRICLGDGLGGFSCSEIPGTQFTTIAIEVGDFNNDGDLDTVLANSDGPVQVCAGNGDGTFACSPIELLTYPTWDVGVGEFNGDDDPDLILATKNESIDDPKLPSRVCFGGAGTGFSCEVLPVAGTESFAVAVADWNLDGADDVAVVQRDGLGEICLGANDGSFACSTISDDPVQARDVVPVVPEPIFPVENDFRMQETLDETGFDNFEPEVAILGNQGSVIVWRTEDLGGSVLRAQLENAQGQALTNTIEVDTVTAGDRFEPDVAMGQTGRFVVVWKYLDATGQHPDNSGTGIAGRLFDANGIPIAGEFTPPTFLTGNQNNAGVAMSPDGSFLVVWDSTEDASGEGLFAGKNGSPVKRTPDGDASAVMGRLFDADGNAQTDEFVINETTANSQFRPRVAARNDGSFVVVWESLTPGFSADVFARIVQADGSLPEGEIPVHAPIVGEQQFPDVDVASDGRFVVAWQSQQDLDDSFGIWARIFDENGTPQSAEFQVNEPSFDRQERARVAFGGGKRFVVAWRDFDVSASRSNEVRAREFELGGRKVGEEFQINRSIDELGSLGYPAVDGARDGRVVFVWPEAFRDDPTVSRVFRRRYESAYAPPMGTTTTSSTSSTTLATTTTTFSTTTTLVTTTTLPPTTVTTTLALGTTTTSSVTTTTEIPALDCGDPVVDGMITATDALFVLAAAVDLENCEPCICDVNDSGMITAADALVTLRIAVGLSGELACQPCI